MSKPNLKKLFSFIIVAAFLSPSFTWAAPDSIDLQDLALPSEVKDLAKNSGSVFYSATSKNKTLMPVHFWGEVGKPGLHFIPVDSKLVKGLSFAGGGNSNAKLEEVVVNRYDSGKVKRFEFDLGEGGDVDAHEYVLKPGDTVFVERDRYIENRAYYTSLFSVALTIISSIFILKRIEEQR